MIRRVIFNAIATYARFAITFVLGLIYTGYVTSKLGLEGFGLVSLAAGTFGISFALESGIGHSVARELTPAFVSKNKDDLRHAISLTFTSSCYVALIVLFIGIAVAIASTYGLIALPVEKAGFLKGLIWLLISEAALGTVRLVLSVWLRAPFAIRLIWLDSIYFIIPRIGKPAVAVIVFSGALSITDAIQLIPYLAVGNFVWGAVSFLVCSSASLIIIPQTRVLPHWSKWPQVKEVIVRIFEALQFSFLAGFTPQLLALVVNATLGLAFNGVWSIVVQVGGYCWQLGEGVVRGVDPLMVYLREEKGESHVRNSLIAMCKLQSYTFVIVCSVVLSICPSLIYLWVGKAWAASSSFELLGESGTNIIIFTSSIIMLHLLSLFPRNLYSAVERTLFGFGHMKHYLRYVWGGALLALVVSGSTMHFAGWLGGAALGVLAGNICAYAYGVASTSKRISVDFLDLDKRDFALGPSIALLVSWPVSTLFWGRSFTSIDISLFVLPVAQFLFTAVIIALLEWRSLLYLLRRVRD